MNTHPKREEIERIYGKISPFELKDQLIELAKQQRNARTLLDAGRGNPNWISATPREAFFTFGQFAVLESRRTWNDGDLAGMLNMLGIHSRFIEYSKKQKDASGMGLLLQMINYGINQKGYDPDEWVYELADGIIGDHYPVPDRMLNYIEGIVHDYVIQELCYNKPPQGRFQLFATEGATAAMCYLFDSLFANELLRPKDKIALMVPIFTPYLEIPEIPRYDLEVVKIVATNQTMNGKYEWHYPQEELNKLKDPQIKALFVVNPTNPPSFALRKETVTQLIHIVQEDNPKLMIISDDVYGTFVDGFRSLMADLPYNTLGVYSFSKYFGVTGWRLGTIALHEHNVFDDALNQLDESKQQLIAKRYESLSNDPTQLKFIDRMVADSRQVALKHTAGLSTPQQVQMAFFCLSALIDQDNIYKNQTIAICHRRKKLLFAGLGIEITPAPNDASYYTEFDLLEWATFNYGNEFADYLQKTYKPIDVLLQLAEKQAIVLLNGGAFFGPIWSIRISLANLEDESYSIIGSALHQILQEYVENWQSLSS